MQGFVRCGNRGRDRNFECLPQALAAKFNGPKRPGGEKQGAMRAEPALVAIHQHTPLTTGDPDQQMLTAIMRELGLPCARRYQLGKWNNLDLIQAGHEFLIRASSPGKCVYLKVFVF
jgi:hypothetical protein